MTRTAIVGAVALLLAACQSTRTDPEPTLNPDEMLELTLSLDQTVIEDGDMDAVVMVEVAASETPVGDRPPVSLAIVFDTSGSMEGNKIENAREAAHGLIESLSRDDEITIVSYGDRAEIPLDRFEIGRDRSDAHEAIDAIEPGGNTCTSCGLETAYGVLAEVGNDRLRRVVLLSDGHANRGTVDEASLQWMAQNANQYWGVETATIGLGRLHNEGSLAAIAQGGTADYYFLPNSQRLASILERELANMHSTVLTNLVLRLTPGDGVVFSGTQNVGAQWDGYDLVLNVGQLAVGETREFLVTLALPPGDMGRAVFAEAQFRDVAGAAYTLNDSARLERSNETARVEESINDLVVARQAQLASAELIDRMMAEYEAGNYDYAWQELQVRADELEVASETYGSEDMRAQAAELRALSNNIVEYGEYDEEAEPEARGEILLQRARSNEIRRGVPAASTYHQPEMYDFSLME